MYRLGFLLVAFSIGGQLFGQVTTATLYIEVTDPTDAVIRGASVTLTEGSTAAVRTQACGDLGECNFTFLAPGTYTASIGAAGFKTLQVSGIEVGAAQNLRRKFVLSVGDVVEKVSVTGEAPMINVVSPDQLENLNSATLTQLPALHRMASSLFQIDTSVSRTGGTSNTTGSFRINGLGAGEASITMDGIPASAHPGTPQGGFRGGFNYIEVASMEAIEEVDISKGVFSAEYGRAMSGNINVVTKSGTNDWHGSLFELFNSDDLNGRQVFLKTRPATTFNQFGGSLGGPILKNRLFIFGVYEGYHDRETTTINGQVPTPSLLNAMETNFPAYHLAMDQFFQPNQPYSATATTAQYIGPGKLSADDNHFEVKPDLYLTSTSRLSATFVRDAPTLSQPLGPATDFFRTFTGNQYRFNVTFTTFRANWSAETRYGWNRANNLRLDNFYNVVDPLQKETSSDIGERRVPGISALGMSINGTSNFIGNAPEWNLEQKITWHLGRHSLKIGGGLYRHRYGESDLENPVLTYNTAQQLINNTPVAAQISFGFEPWVARQLDFGLFVQDDWRVSRKLSLNLGLRYDYFDHMVADGPNGGWPHLVNASFSNFAAFTLTPFRPTDNPYDTHPFNWGPRFGFAYNPDGNGKTSIRGGIGIMKAPVNTSIFEQTGINAYNEPFRINVTQVVVQSQNITFPTYAGDVLFLVKNGLVAPAYQLIDPHIKAPYAINYTLGLERELTKTLMIESAFVGTRGVELVQPRYYNQPDPVTGIAPNPTLGSSRYWDNSDSSIYSSWQTSLRKRYGNHLSGALHYTWGKTLAYGFGDVTYGVPTTVQDFFNVRANRGRPPQDIAQNFVSEFVYDEPLFANSGRLLRYTLGGWQGSGVFTAQTGTPLTVTESTASIYGRPDLINPGAAIRDTGLQYLNPAAFKAVPTSPVSGQQIRPGSAGGGAVIGPGLWNLDFSLSKNARIRERVLVQFRADMLNVFNHANLNVVNTNFSSGTFGQRTGATNPRAVQFMLRLSF